MLPVLTPARVRAESHASAWRRQWSAVGASVPATTVLAYARACVHVWCQLGADPAGRGVVGGYETAHLLGVRHGEDHLGRAAVERKAKRPARGRRVFESAVRSSSAMAPRGGAAAIACLADSQ